MTCPKLGPWLGDEKVPYDGLVVAAVDHLGRNVVDCLSAGCKGRDEGRLLVTFGHDGPWNVDYPTDEHHFTIVVWGRPDGAVCDPASESQCHREDTCGRWADVQAVLRVPVDAHCHGRPHRPAELYPHASKVLREAARRTLADPENVTPSSQAARLNRASAHHLTAGPLAEVPGTPRARATSCCQRPAWASSRTARSLHSTRTVCSAPLRLCEGSATVAPTMRFAVRCRRAQLRSRDDSSRDPVPGTPPGLRRRNGVRQGREAESGAREEPQAMGFQVVVNERRCCASPLQPATGTSLGKPPHRPTTRKGRGPPDGGLGPDAGAPSAARQRAVGQRRRVRFPSIDRKRKPDGAISLRRPPAAGTRIWA